MKLTIRPMKLSCPVSLICFALASTSFALDPPPGGGYPNEVTALGEDALFSVSIGDMNTAAGYEALYSDTTGFNNTAIGVQALYGNTTGFANLGVGDYALLSNTTGTYNIAIGYETLLNSKIGDGNVAVGWSALARTTAGAAGASNVAIGFSAMSFSTTGAFNTAVGNVVMAFNSTGSFNVAMGHGAMNLSSGSNNVALGQSAGLNFAGNNNIAIGQLAGQNVTTGSNNIEIGSQGTRKDSGIIRLGDPATQTKTFIAGISGATVSVGAAVMINSKGQLGVTTSSARYKDNIQPMAKASEALLSLKPVTFRYKKELDPEAIPQFGLVAEQVAKVDPDLVARDESGKPYTVRYEAVNAMLLNEFLKEHQQVTELKTALAEQQRQISTLTAAFKKRARQIQQVRAESETSRSAPRLVAED